MKTCDQCTFKRVDEDFCEYFMRQITIRDREKQCPYFIQKK